MAMDYGEADSSSAPAYVPTQPYEASRILEAPRVMIPPPSLDYNGGKAFFHVASEPFERADGRCGNPQFLRAIVSANQLDFEHVMLNWDYESRRHAQLILPFILLGPSTKARDPSFVQENGVSLLLAIRSAQAASKYPHYLEPSRFPSAQGIQTATFDLDTPYELITNIRSVVKMINDHLESSCTTTPITSVDEIRGKVMIFCESGNERSAVVVAAYIMLLYGIGAVAAIQVVQSQRFCINLEDAMKSMLLAFEDVLVAEKGVTAAHISQNRNMSQLMQAHQHVPTLNKASKRNFDRAYESDEDMSDSAEWAENDGQRAGVAPFADVGP
jgi:serine/threonine/tyrosine-interacting protein